MRIAVNGRQLAHGRGIGRYTVALLRAMAEQSPGDELRVFVPGTQPVEAPVDLVRHRVGSRVLFGATAAIGRPRLDRLVGGADVAWAPAPAPVALSPGVPLVLTVHDLSWLQRPGDYTAYERAWHAASRIPALVRRAARIIAVSGATRDDILARWDLPPDRVVVVHSGPGIGPPAPGTDLHRAGSAGPPYFLAVGAIEPRKAPDVLVRAFALARAEGLNAELWFAGAGQLHAPAGDGVRLLGPQDDSALHRLYAGALALAHPALLEGFAFPPVEALVHGIPVVASDLPVLRETLGDGALRVPPGDSRALADALLRLEREPELRARLVADGQAAVGRLSWARAAAETRAVLAEAAGA